MSDAQPNPVFFLDRNHGLLIRDLLRRVGVSVKVHRDFGWSHDRPDVEIIRYCAEHGYVILSGDKAMSRVPEERQAIIDGKCKLFMFDDSHSTRTEDWVASVLIARARMIDIVRKTNGPLFVTIKPCRAVGHIGTPKFVEKAGGGWRAAAQSAAPEPPPFQLENPSQRKHKKQQVEFDFPPNAV